MALSFIGGGKRSNSQDFAFYGQTSGETPHVKVLSPPPSYQPVVKELSQG
jgi:hypothetical protein